MKHLKGVRFGHVVALWDTPSYGVVKCLCDCGNEVEVHIADLKEKLLDRLCPHCTGQMLLHRDRKAVLACKRSGLTQSEAIKKTGLPSHTVFHHWNKEALLEQELAIR